MTLFALALVLLAAVFHATWNLLAKRVGDGGAAFVWLFGLCSLLIYAPLAVVVVLVSAPHLGPAQYLFMFGSGVLHLGYFVLLQRGYAVGDLSLVYPLARGTGPLLATAAAIVLFGERPSPLALFGIALITAGVFVLTSEGVSIGSGLGAGVLYGLLTGVFIAAYTIWDKQAVSALLIPPLLQSWATILVTTHVTDPARDGPEKRSPRPLARPQARSSRGGRPQPALLHTRPHGARLHPRKLRRPCARNLHPHRGRHGGAIALRRRLQTSPHRRRSHGRRGRRARARSTAAA